MFSTNLSDGKCQRPDCSVCYDPEQKGPSLCQIKNVVYEGVCKICENLHKLSPNSKHQGKYIGETYRTLYERSIEHKASLNRWDQSSFMFKHWALKHSELDSPPDFKFKVLKKHDGPLSRLIHEAVEISKSATMNSKAEWGGVQNPPLGGGKR